MYRKIVYNLTGKEKKRFEIIIKRSAQLMPNKAERENERDRERSKRTYI